MEIIVLVICGASMVWPKFQSWLIGAGFVGRSFVHVDLPHFFFNMISLLYFAHHVEWAGVVYFVGVLFAGIGTRTSYGASGGVVAVVCCAAIQQPLTWIVVLFVPVPMFVWAMVAALYRNSRTDWAAHMIGAVVGTTAGVLML